MKLKRTLGSAIAIALSASMIPCTVGCSSTQQQQVKTVVARIGAEIPKVLPLVQTVTSLAETISPAEAPLAASVSTKVQAGLTQLAALCTTYSSAPSDSVWQSIEAAINSLVGTGASALLDAANITNPNSRLIAQGALGALQTALLIIDGFVQSTLTPAQMTATAELRPYKLEQLKPYLDRGMVEQATGYSFDTVYAHETALGF